MDFDLKLTSLRITEGSAGQDVTVTIKPKYTGERRYSLPSESLAELRSDLERLVPTRGPKPPSGQNQIAVKAPKKWMVGSGLPRHPVVLLVFDPQTEAQGGYALAAKAALKMAAELVKQAEAIKAQARPKAN